MADARVAANDDETGQTRCNFEVSTPRLPGNSQFLDHRLEYHAVFKAAVRVVGLPRFNIRVKHVPTDLLDFLEW